MNVKPHNYYITMKAIAFLLFAGTLFILISCNSGKGQAFSANIAATSRSKAADTLEDPDPTDTVPASAYNINTYQKRAVDLTRKTLQQIYKSDVAKNQVDSASRKFRIFEYDLNDDGNKEIFVALSGPYFCGSGGCTSLLLNSDGSVITTFTVMDFPVIIAVSATHNWRDLYISSHGSLHIIRFNGKQYPSNPSVEPLLKTPPAGNLPRVLNFANEPYPTFSF